LARDGGGTEVFGVDITSNLRPMTEPGAAAAFASSEHPAIAMPNAPGWHTILAPMTNVLIPEPQMLTVHSRRVQATTIVCSLK
jgi:hypothetical protein